MAICAADNADGPVAEDDKAGFNVFTREKTEDKPSTAEMLGRYLRIPEARLVEAAVDRARGDVGGEPNVSVGSDARADARVAGSSSSSRSSSVSVAPELSSNSILGGAGGASGFCIRRAYNSERIRPYAFAAGSEKKATVPYEALSTIQADGMNK